MGQKRKRTHGHGQQCGDWGGGRRGVVVEKNIRGINGNGKIQLRKVKGNNTQCVHSNFTHKSQNWRQAKCPQDLKAPVVSERRRS